MEHSQLFDLLESNYLKYNATSFIESDPISIPHKFTKLQDIEIAGFFSATLAWGLRKTIVKKSMELMELFDFSPYDFVINHSEKDLKSLKGFKHRTFNYTDLLYFIHFFNEYYTVHQSLETIFIPKVDGAINIASGINDFYTHFVGNEFFPARTGKHVASPLKKSACKRINMFLRWMVRQDNIEVDFGLWKHIKPSLLICPCDVHVERIGRKLGLISRKQVDWNMALELTDNLKKFDPVDPVKYDFALFGMGLNKMF